MGAECTSSNKSFQTVGLSKANVRKSVFQQKDRIEQPPRNLLVGYILCHICDNELTKENQSRWNGQCEKTYKPKCPF